MFSVFLTLISNNIIDFRLYTTKFDAVIVRKAIITMQLLIANSYVRTGHAISELDAANAAFEAIQMVE